MKPQTPLDELRALEELLLAAGNELSEKRLAELFADDFLEIGSSGRRYNKHQAIERMKQPGRPASQLTEFEARYIAPNLALVTYRVHRRAEGKVVLSLRSSLWKLAGGRWQVVFHQGTPTTER